MDYLNLVQVCPHRRHEFAVYIASNAEPDQLAMSGSAPANVDLVMPGLNGPR